MRYYGVILRRSVLEISCLFIFTEHLYLLPKFLFFNFISKLEWFKLERLKVIFKDHLVPTFLPWWGIPSTRSGCSRSPNFLSITEIL